MRRVAARGGAIAMVGMLVMGVPATAEAARGVLIVNDRIYYNPSGCFAIDDLPAYVFNDTSHVAFIHEGSKCDVDINAVLLLGQMEIAKSGKSVFVG
ncbi:hypothetical protein HD597_011224 [Nonomuraea thailandensis]|uniref:Uncharacterized protein n=1 Tax=Nonomuraea thailandensis TaxID=1188745 RepID=A0A9X2GUT6_9ACTN|nr:hypothetical protein [Nonomuraea thailandensis]MCP2364204.1 hypothetical protein [Nonomuraea thailandensis]